MKHTTMKAILTAVIVAAGALSARAAAPELYLEYVATDGSAYIDTGVIGKAGTLPDEDELDEFLNSLC